jgi:lipid-A-disaccharide synthase
MWRGRSRPRGPGTPARTLSLTMASVRILISAGEASGEMYGAQLIDALRRAGEKKASELRSSTGEAPVPPQNQLEFFGVGGDRMRAAGCDIVVDAKDLAVVGITEILSHLPKILKLYRRLIREADRRKPDLAIVIDSPAFNWRVARRMKKRGIPTVYYVAPQFWAWRQGRVRLLRDYIDKALVIFPFEERFYRERGVDATFVGHPLADMPVPDTPREQFAIQHGLKADKTWIALLPGSRRKEFRMNLPAMIDSVRLLGNAHQYVLPIASTLDFQWAHDQIFHGSHSQRGRIEPFIALTRDTPASLHFARAAIVASGTATVEAAMMNTPFVMVYRVSPLTYLLGKPRVKVPRFAMVNLIAGEEIVPELVQRDFTAGNVVARLNEILADGPTRDRMLEGFGRVKALLRAPQGASGAVQHPADRAAEIILSLRLRPKP